MFQLETKKGFYGLMLQRNPFKAHKEVGCNLMICLHFNCWSENKSIRFEPLCGAQNTFCVSRQKWLDYIITKYWI